jgi:hypothetical protein
MQARAVARLHEMWARSSFRPPLTYGSYDARLVGDAREVEVASSQLARIRLRSMLVSAQACGRAPLQ